MLVDTGSTRCLLGAVDLQALGIDQAELSGRVPVDGISGTEECWAEDGYLLFASGDGDAQYVYRVNLLISRRNPVDGSADSPSSRRLPSILGRDVLHRWNMFYSPYNPDPSLRLRYRQELWIGASR